MSTSDLYAADPSLACLRCSAIYDEPTTRGFCAYCWNESILPGSRDVVRRGVLSAEAYIGLMVAAHRGLQEDLRRARDVAVHAKATLHAAATREVLP